MTFDVDAQVDDTCTSDPQRKAWAQTQCGIISSDVFQACHAVEPYQKYLDRYSLVLVVVVVAVVLSN